MDSLKKNEFINFIMQIQDSTDYLGMVNLMDQHSYKIYARNAYAGVWVKSKNAFLISRFKVGPRPYISFEFHWDASEPYGTVKPLELIEKCPFEVKQNYSDIEAEEILQYLEKLEENNPIIEGINSFQERKGHAISFQKKLRGSRK